MMLLLADLLATLVVLCTMTVGFFAFVENKEKMVYTYTMLFLYVFCVLFLGGKWLIQFYLITGYLI